LPHASFDECFTAINKELANLRLQTARATGVRARLMKQQKAGIETRRRQQAMKFRKSS
jgi:hypothetical protein